MNYYLSQLIHILVIHADQIQHVQVRAREAMESGLMSLLTTRYNLRL